MGLFDRLFKREKKESVTPEPQNNTNKVAIPTEKTSVSADYITDGGESFLKIDFEDKAFGKIKDTTRLVVSTVPSAQIGNEAIYKAAVFYYDSGWAVMINDQGRTQYDGGPELMREGEYGMFYGGAIVQLGIDFEKALTDKEYQEVLMSKLLEESRVQKYMEEGLKPNPEVKSGNYIGEVMPDANGVYIKHFKTKFGELAHNSQERKDKMELIMKARMKETQIMEEQKKIEEAQAKIDALRRGNPVEDGQR